MQTKTIAVVGCGAAAVAFLKALFKRIGPERMTPLDIVIFEPSIEPGVGLAYQDDYDELLINRPAETMSIDAEYLNDYRTWLNDQGINPETAPIVTTQLHSINSTASDHAASYTSRRMFGRYLKDKLNESIKQASQQISLQILCQKVLRIKKKSASVPNNNRFILSTQKTTYTVDYVVLATGNNASTDYYQLSGTPRYIHQVYPMKNTLMPISPDQRVAIIGNGLTAIDTVLGLRKNAHQNTILLLSRNYYIPHIRGNAERYALSFLTYPNLLGLIQKKGLLSLRDVLRLFRQELKNIFGVNWKTLFRTDDSSVPFAEHMAKEIKKSEESRAYQAFLGATNQIIEKLWHHLRFEDKKLFVDVFHRAWLRTRAPIPLHNGTVLAELAARKQLNYAGNLKSIVYDNTTNQYNISFHESTETVKADWVINAIGPSRFVTSKDEVLFNLIQCGLAKSHPLGGLHVDFDTALIISARDRKVPGLYLCGHNTFGTYYYVSSLEMIAKQSAKIADHLLSDILRGQSFVQETNYTSCDTGSPGYIA